LSLISFTNKHLSILQRINICQLLAGLLLLLTTSFLNAQSDGILNANISPQNALLKVDGKIYDQEAARSVTLPAGEYTIEIWAPRFATFRDTVVVPAGGKATYSKGLTVFSEDFKAFRESDRAVAGNKTWRNLSMVGLIGLSAGATFLAINGASKQDEHIASAQLANRRIERSINPLELELAANEYNAAKDDYDRARSQAVLGTVVAVAGWVGTAYYIIRQLKKKKIARPQYQPKDPFTFQPRPSLPKQRQFVPLASPNALGFSMQF
jgi:hypothetical protein